MPRYAQLDIPRFQVLGAIQRELSDLGVNHNYIESCILPRTQPQLDFLLVDAELESHGSTLPP